MKARILTALALLFVLPAAAPARTQTDAQQLVVVVSTLLAQAPHNFAAMRLTSDDSDSDHTTYQVKPFGTHCRLCKMYDYYALPSYKESWYVEDRWTLPGKWTPDKTVAYAVQTLRPILTGFALHKTVSSYSKYPTLTWRGSGSRYVYVDTFEGGYTIRVGHDLDKPVHQLHAVDSSQLEQLKKATQNMLRLGAPAASNNFADLLMGTAHKTFGEDEYGVNVSFGPMMRKCDITAVTSSLGFKGFQPKWVLTCDTLAMAGSAKALKAKLRESILAALPDGFTESTDPNDLVLDDYRWVNQNAMESIDLFSDTYRGAVRFTIQLFHYLPKEATSGD